MSTASDTFARFVDVLADSLDDHAASSRTLASRVHLSRFHFDRLVSAAAGEPPATLRRRILLERAAYRLITTDHDVLRVAVEAGYASNEAFTRAFTRAFGRAPSRLAAPADELPAATRRARCTSTRPGACGSPADRKVTAMDLLTRMVEHHVWLVGELVDRCGRLTPEQLDAPVEISVDGIDDDPTVRSLLARLVGQMAMWDAATHDRPYDIDAERAETLDDIRAKLAEVGPAFLDQVRAIVDEGRLDETFVDAICDPPRDLHVRRDGRPRAHVRRPPPDAGLRRARRRRHHRTWARATR